MTTVGRASTSARQRIIESARYLFATRGFGATSIKAIAERAGVSQGLMYSYFGSKDDLLRSIFEEGLQDIWRSFPAPSSEPLGGIEELLKRSFAIVAEHNELWHLLYALRFQPEIVDRLALDIDGWRLAVETRLNELCTKAGIPNPRIEAKILFALIDGMNQHSLLSGGAYPIDEVIETVMTRLRETGAK